MFPVPFKNREIIVYGFGSNRIKTHGSIVVMAKSFSLLEDPEYKELIGNVKDPRMSKDLIELLIHSYGFEITPIAPDEIKCRGIMLLDPKLDVVPDSLINWGTT